MAELVQQLFEASASTSSGLAAGGNTVDKFSVAQEKKAAGDEAFKKDDITGALRNYHEALLYLKGLDKNATQQALGQPVPQPPPIDSVDDGKPKPRTEVEELTAKVYLNIAQCLFKTKKWKRVIEAAESALRYNPTYVKAKFLIAKAHAGLGLFEKAIKTLEELLKDSDPNEKPTLTQELVRVHQMEKEVTDKHDKKMRGFLNKERKLKTEIHE